MKRLELRVARSLLGLALAACVIGVAAAVLGGISTSLGPFTVRIRHPWPPALAGLLLAALTFGRRPRAAVEALAWWWGAIERHAAAAVLVVSAVTLMTGLAWGTYAAGGSDSYCYLNQAELFVRGAVRDHEPLATDPRWPGTADAFLPAGHNSSPQDPGSFVPICPAGYPLLLAGASRAGGRPAMFGVTPLLGGLAVWFAFVLGRRAAGPAAGLLAAVLTATSPILLYQIVQPMNDVPAAALWAGALVAAGWTVSTSNSQRPTPNAQRPTPNAQLPTPNAQLPTPSAQRPTPNAQVPDTSDERVAVSSEGPAPSAQLRTPTRSELKVGNWKLGSRRWEFARALSAGALTGLAITIRPNLVPLAAVVGIATIWLPRNLPAAGRLRIAAAFGAAALPGILLVMGIQQAMYGSPLKSGYGDLSALFSLGHVLPNLALYPRWLLDVHTPLVLAGLAAPLAVPRAARAWTLTLVAFAAATLACYLGYVVFDAWWYQRFLLPAVPPLLALTAAAIVGAVMRLPDWLRAPLFLAVAAAVPMMYIQIAAERGVFGLRDFEARFRAAGEYVATHLPADAVVLTVHHSGSVRFYSGRSTAGWDNVPPGALDDTLEFLRARGRTPYLLLETWELRAFRERFSTDRLGGLEWPHMVEIDSAVRIYDPADYERYRRGERVRTERMRSR